VNGAVEAKIQLPIEGLADGVAFGAGSAWVASGGGNTGSAPSLVRIDPANGRILAAIDATESGGRRLRVLNGGISFAAGRVWLSRSTTASRGDVVSVDPATNRLDGRPVTVGSGPTTLLAAFGFLWVDNTGLTIGIKPAPSLPASVSRIDPRTRQSTTEPFAGAPSAGFGSVWVRDDNTVTRFNPATGRAIARIQVPGVVAVAFGEGRVWAVSQSASASHSNGSTAKLIQIDPRSNRVVGTPSHLETSLPVAIAVSGHDLWIADYHGGLLHFKLTHP
jgi:DNA-binding beta-propeller fold protein YncE